jgi:hypothetical protein
MQFDAKRFYDFLTSGKVKNKYLRLLPKSQDAFVVQPAGSGEAVYVKRCAKDAFGYACDSKYYDRQNMRSIKDHVTIVPSSRRSPFHVTLYLTRSNPTHERFLRLVNSTNSAGTRCAMQKAEACVNLYLTSTADGRAFRMSASVKRLLDNPSFADIRARFDVQLAALTALTDLHRTNASVVEVGKNRRPTRIDALNTWRSP